MSLVESVLKRPTGSNLLAWVLLLTGLYSATSLTREFFPESSPESASVTAIWPGAAPEDLEEGVVRRVEDVTFCARSRQVLPRYQPATDTIVVAAVAAQQNYVQHGNRVESHAL